MQRSLTTSSMQSSCWVNYDRPVSMTLFAAAVRAGPAQQSRVRLTALTLNRWYAGATCRLPLAQHWLQHR